MYADWITNWASLDDHKDMKRVFNEKEWKDIEPKTTSNYPKSDTLADKTAWDYVNNSGRYNKSF